MNSFQYMHPIFPYFFLSIYIFISIYLSININTSHNSWSLKVFRTYCISRLTVYVYYGWMFLVFISSSHPLLLQLNQPLRVRTCHERWFDVIGLLSSCGSGTASSGASSTDEIVLFICFVEHGRAWLSTVKLVSHLEYAIHFYTIQKLKSLLTRRKIQGGGEKVFPFSDFSPTFFPLA